ncbi:MAG TPA: hypothetical protein VHF92_17920, partial [Geodermatophilus sp.]|nr:hypothetical protein [Geodermatophilus sp.]
MHRTRLLLAVPAATALVFTGLAPASANVAGNHDNGDDASAEVLEIEDEAELRNGDDLLAVTFEYRCEDDGEDVEADVRAEDGDILYEKNNVNLDCDDR